MIAYNDALRKACDPLWEQEYLQGHTSTESGVLSAPFVPDQLVQISSAPSEPVPTEPNGVWATSRIPRLERALA